MNRFSGALSRYLDFQKISVRQFAALSSVDDSDLSRVLRNKKSISRDSLIKVLAAVEAKSGRPQAILLLRSYLTDEIPSEYQPIIEIRDFSALRLEDDPKDPLESVVERWTTKARTDPNFAEWWIDTDAAFLAPRVVETSAKRLADFRDRHSKESDNPGEGGE